MDLLSLKRPRLFCYAAACGAAGALGAFVVLPGVLVGLALAAVSIDSGKRARLLPLCLAGLLGSGALAVMNWAPSLALLTQGSLAVRGATMLTVKAAVVGGLAGALTGMSIGIARYRPADVLWLLPVGMFWAATRLLPPGPIVWLDWVKTVAATTAALLAWLHYMKRDRAGILVGCMGALGAALGTAAGLACGGFTLACAGYGVGVGLAVYLLDEGLEVTGGAS